MFKPSATARRMAVIIACIVAAYVCVAAFFTADIPALMIGAALGFVASAAKIWFLERGIDKSLDMDPKQAAMYMRVNYIGRFFLTGAALAFGALSTHIDFIAVAVGLVSMPLAAYVVRIFFRKQLRAEEAREKLPPPLPIEEEEEPTGLF